MNRKWRNNRKRNGDKRNAILISVGCRKVYYSEIINVL
jgi:hypothetical protein